MIFSINSVSIIFSFFISIIIAKSSFFFNIINLEQKYLFYLIVEICNYFKLIFLHGKGGIEKSEPW